MAGKSNGACDDSVHEYFLRAFRFSVKQRPADLVWIRSLSNRLWNRTSFLAEYSWVVMVSGFRVSIIADLWPDVRNAFLGFSPARIVASCRLVRIAALRVFRHEGKVDAIIAAAERLAEIETPVGIVIREMSGEEFVEWISNWPYMGPANRVFLARNLGFREFAKPDRHLQALAHRFGYADDVAEMCHDLGLSFGLDPAEVDMVLWRYRSEGEPV